MRYSAVLLDHFLNPRNAGLMRDADGVGQDEYEGCGDLTRFYLRVGDGRASEIRFQTYGCGPTIAAASAASELCTGRLIEDLVNVKAEDIEMALGGLPEDRRHAADVAAGALRNAALDHLTRRGPRNGPDSRGQRGDAPLELPRPTRSGHRGEAVAPLDQPGAAP